MVSFGSSIFAYYSRFIYMASMTSSLGKLHITSWPYPINTPWIENSHCPRCTPTSEVL
jgi:hypothetical protein